MPKLVQSHGHDPSFAQRGAVSGRLVCDTYLAAKDLLRSQKNYSLTELGMLRRKATCVRSDTHLCSQNAARAATSRV